MQIITNVIADLNWVYWKFIKVEPKDDLNNSHPKTTNITCRNNHNSDCCSNSHNNQTKNESLQDRNDQVAKFLRKARLVYGIGVPTTILSYFLVIFAYVWAEPV